MYRISKIDCYALFSKEEIVPAANNMWKVYQDFVEIEY
jgi:hypothetical protein